MSGMEIANSILQFMGGLGVFLFSMKVLSSNLESMAGNNLKNMLRKVTNNKLMGVGVGTGVTMVIQSSTATTVMVIGFVNVGLLTLTQAATIIFGANIGTTITAQIVALGVLGTGGVSLNMSLLMGAFAGIGALINLFTEKEKIRRVCNLMIGFGMIFIGLSLMSSAMTLIAKSDAVINFLALPAFQNVFLLVIMGTIITAIIHSSSAVTGIIIAMLAAGLLDINQGIYLAFGSNIGTCITALMVSIGTSTNAKRAAMIHLIFNVLGVVLFMLIGIGVKYGDLMAKLFPGAVGTQLAMMHTIFNLVTVALVLPFTNLLVKLVEKIIPDRISKNDKTPHLHYINEQILATPPVAVAQMKKEVIDMAELAMENFNKAVDDVLSAKPSNQEAIITGEEQLNFLNREIPRYLVKLSQNDLDEKDALFISTIYHTVSDLERIGDYSKNLLEYSEKMQKEELVFSDDAKEEIRQMQASINKVYEYTKKVFTEFDLASIKEAYKHEQEVDDMKEQMIQNHIDRLSCGSCTPDTGSIYYAIASDSERVADHLINIANSVRTFAKTNGRKAAKEEPAAAK